MILDHKLRKYIITKNNISLKINDLAPKPDLLNSIDPPSYPDLYLCS